MAKFNAKSKWEIGDVFIIPLLDGSGCIAQVVGREREILNSATIAIFDVRQEFWSDNLPGLTKNDVFSLILATKDLLDSGRWRVLSDGKGPIKEVNPYEHLRSNGFIGAKVLGSGFIEDFINAFYGLEDWDDWYLPNYLDQFLISLDKKPLGRLKFCGRHDGAGSAS
jgi:hypothetical protein